MAQQKFKKFKKSMKKGMKKTGKVGAMRSKDLKNAEKTDFQSKAGETE